MFNFGPPFHIIFAAGVKERGGSLSTFSISSGSSSVVSEEKFVNSLIAFKTGFVCSVGAGKVAVFELERSLKELIGDDEIKFKGIGSANSIKMLFTCKKATRRSMDSKMTVREGG